MTTDTDIEAACEADMQKVLAHAGAPASGKIRMEPAYTDPETGERYPAELVAEVRVRRAGDFVAIVISVADHAADPSAWCELLDDEIRAAAPCGSYPRVRR